MTLNDLADLRRSAGLREDEDIKANDFLFAMMIRLGARQPHTDWMLSGSLTTRLTMLVVFYVHQVT